jgi:hypothetical protein
MTSGFALPPRPALPRVRWSNEHERNAEFTRAAPRIPWDKFIRDSFQPQPGEHVTILGSTGKGKSNLMNHLLPKWPYTVVLGTKAQDETMSRLASQGYVVWQKWKALPAEQYPRRVIWPKPGKISEMVDRQQEVFTDVIEHVYAEGGRPKERPIGWAIAIDELWWFTHMLKMEKMLRVILQHARSSGITLIGATQRPAFIPTEFYSQPTHLFFFATQDDNNLQKVGDINAGNKRLIRDLVSNLEQYQVLYVNNVTGQMARTRTPAPIETGK